MDGNARCRDLPLHSALVVSLGTPYCLSSVIDAITVT